MFERTGAIAVGDGVLLDNNFCGRDLGSETRRGIGLVAGMVVGIGGVGVGCSRLRFRSFAAAF